jgi:Spy/CpxP family protein refolding chaperone
MRAFSKWVSFGSMAGLVALSGCASSTEGQAAAAAQVGMNEDPPEVAHMGFIREALAKVSLRADQRPLVEQLGREAEARHEPIRNARIALQGALADQVTAGKIDRTLLKPQIDALLQTIEQSRAADRVALGRLHDILDKTQRNQFVDAVEDGFKQRMHDRPGMQHAKRWAADLNLSDQQRDQIRASMQARFQGQREAMKEQMHTMRKQGKKMLESFREDQFTPDGTIFGRDKIERGISRMIDFAETALPVLTPEQRAIAAQKIRTRGGRF